MVQKVFAGSIDNDFNNPGNWQPVGVPQSGDRAGISRANPVASGVLPSGVLISYSSIFFNGGASGLTLRDATVPAATTIDAGVSFGGGYNATLPASLQFAGAVVNQGTIIVSGGAQPISLPSGTTLTNTGTMDVYTGAVFSAESASVTFNNTGLIRVLGVTPSGLAAVLGPAINGTGTISASLYSKLEFGGAVARGQTVQFVGGADAGSSLQIDQPSSFAAEIDGFVSGDMLTLAMAAATSVSYAANSASGGTLRVFNGGTTPVASLYFSGVYSVSNFNLTESGSSLVITTNVTNSSTGSTATPNSAGVFRFFGTSDGTHFFTGSVAERDTLLVARPDLVQENNGFGAVTVATAATESVYRFFDTVHGTHFFTASATERDQVIATRSDLTYEQNAVFLEHTTAQPGDLAVYRLFSKTDGTHFYTADPAELSALTMPGGPGYRGDLVSEGVSFYAPAGSYT